MATFSYTLPTVSGSENTWGTTLNANWTSLGTFLGALDSAELAVLDGITSTTAELNLLTGLTDSLSGLTATAAELNLLDGATVTTAEINILDGGTAATATTLVDADRLVANDGGTMVQVALTDISTYAFTALSIDEDDMVSDSASKLPTQQSVKAYVDATVAASTSVGVGQTWQDVSASRAIGTSYQNTAGRAIMVNVCGASSGSQYLEVSTDGTTWVQVAECSKNGGDTHRATLSAIIPDTHYYRYTGASSITVWAELR